MMRVLLIGFSVVLCLGLFWCGGAQAHAATVLIIESYHAEFEWDKKYVYGIRSVLEPEHTVLTFEMDTKRLPETAYRQRAEAALAYYHDVEPDLVVLGDDNACSLLAAPLLDAKVPLVYIGVNENPRIYNFYGWPHVAGVVERPLFKQSVRLAASLLPDEMHKVLFITDGSRSSHLLMDHVFRRGEPCEVLNVNVDIKHCGTFEEWKNVILSAETEGYDTVFIGLHQRVFNGPDVMDSDLVLEWTSHNLPVPLFAFWDFSVKKGGAVGGLVHSGLEQGRIAGELALDLLNGRRGEVIPRQVEQGILLFSRSELARWDIVLPQDMTSTAILLD